MNSGIRSAGCRLSESIVSAWVKPASFAARRPCSTAEPLPWFCGSTHTAQARVAGRHLLQPLARAVVAAVDHHPHRVPLRAAAATVENRRSPVL